MKIIYEKLPSKKIEYVATIGVFDGIHLGHQFILKKVKEYASCHKLPSLVITFDFPPQKLLKKKFLGCITDLEDKIKFIKNLDIDYLWILKTNLRLLKYSEEEFFKYLSCYFSLHTLIVGEDFRFGYRAKADTSTLRNLAKKYNFNLVVLKKKKKKEEIISSSLIRKSIKEGDFKKVKLFLGRNYYLKGKVIKGEGLGKKIGFPTANLEIKNYVIPKEGVYAVYVDINKRRYLGAFNIGRKSLPRPSKKICFEVHILNFKKRIYGEIIKISFLEKIREERKFSSWEKLKEKIKEDIQSLLKKYSPLPQNIVSLY
jgi:riboflavin kinase/FMN adenylyltransferase